MAVLKKAASVHRVDRLKEAIAAHNAVVENSADEVMDDGSIVRKSGYDKVKKKREYAKQLEREVRAERRSDGMPAVNIPNKRRKIENIAATLAIHAKEKGSGKTSAKAAAAKAARTESATDESAPEAPRVPAVLRKVATVNPFHDEDARDMFEDSIDNDEMVMDEL